MQYPFSKTTRQKVILLGFLGFHVHEKKLNYHGEKQKLNPDITIHCKPSSGYWYIAPAVNLQQKPEHQYMKRQVHKNGTISKYIIYNKLFDTCCSPLATFVSSQLDALDSKQATSFSPELQPTLLLFYSLQHMKTISIFGHCFLDSTNYPARKCFMETLHLVISRNGILHLDCT